MMLAQVSAGSRSFCSGDGEFEESSHQRKGKNASSPTSPKKGARTEIRDVRRCTSLRRNCIRLKQVLERYATLHRECTGLEYESLRGMYSGNNEEEKRSPRCRYVVWNCTFGLGNKLMSLISTFLYAILSQRVLLIDSPGWEHLFCEPFPGSPLQVPQGFSLSEAMAASFADFHNSRCADSSRKEGPCSRHPDVVEVAFTGTSQPADHSFLVCPGAMSAVRHAPFLHFRNSNQYFAVGFFLNRALRPLLELLFPEHNGFHTLAQAFLSPSDDVWARIHDQYGVSHRRMQLRESKGEYRQFYDDAAPLCILSKAALCPIELEELKEMERQQGFANEGRSNVSRPVVSVFVASLVGGQYERLKQSVAKLEPEMRQRFVVVAQEADREQREDVVHQQKALVDMWVLRLSAVLITSVTSTFGYSAQGLGGLTPFHLKSWRDNACPRAPSSDPCFHFAPRCLACEPPDSHVTVATRRGSAPSWLAQERLPTHRVTWIHGGRGGPVFGFFALLKHVVNSGSHTWNWTPVLEQPPKC